MQAKQSQPLGKWVRSERAALLPSSRQSLWVNSRDSIELTECLLSAIESARNTLWVVSPFIDDTRVVRALKNAKARRVRIKVITDIRNNRGRGKQYLTRGFEAKPEEANNVDAHQACIRTLSRSRISCRSPTHYPHFKLIVADDRIAYLSSANLAKNSLGGDTKSSLEAGLAIVRQEQLDHLLQFLSQLWSSCPFRLILNEKDVSIEQCGSGEQIALCSKIARASGLLVNSPGEGFFSLTDSIIASVNEAAKEMLFVSMSFFDADKVPLLEPAVLAALKRGVRVTALVRPEHFTKEVDRGRYPDPATKRLIEHGMRLQGITALHAKGLLIDMREALIFSANINPFSLTTGGESNHMELGLKLTPDDTCFEDVARFLSDLQRASSQQFVLA